MLVGIAGLMVGIASLYGLSWFYPASKASSVETKNLFDNVVVTMNLKYKIEKKILENDFAPLILRFQQDNKDITTYLRILGGASFVLTFVSLTCLINAFLAMMGVRVPVQRFSEGDSGGKPRPKSPEDSDQMHEAGSAKGQ